MNFDQYVPSKLDDEAFMSRLAAYFRSAASPGAAEALLRMNTEIDIRHVLPAIHVPTLVMHRTGDRSAPAKTICRGRAIRTPSWTRYRNS